ncbi:acyltransferase [Arthrobacter sp. HMWF013]|uniref:acyltransferase n=1 Tax=Arthrobacter sp. HMWF013 TaxID=2056849 RepID=UPI000D3ACBD2|nr:acetyltransferase [Arthrobacter sp. HMWF013]
MINARLHGISGRLPLGSQISGLRNVKIGADFVVHGPVWIEAIQAYADENHESSISIGESFRASDRLHITAIGTITIGDCCLFGSSVFIGDHAHGEYRGTSSSDPSIAPAERRLGNQGDVFIGSNCWLGDNVVVVGPVNIGDGAIIAANSVVTTDISARTMVAGVPAKVIKTYDAKSQQWRQIQRNDGSAYGATR